MLSLPFFFYRVGVMESLEREENEKFFFVANPSWPIGRWLVKRYGSCFEGVFVFPSVRRKKSSSRAAEYILVDWTNKSYGLSLGRYARRRDPIGIHEVHLAIVM